MSYLDADVKAYVEMMLAHANAAAGQAAALQAGHTWADNTGAVAVLTTETVLASVSYTPKVSGKLRIIATVVVNNTGTVAHTLTPRLAHGPATNLTDDYTGLPAVNVVSGSGANNGFAIVFEYTGGAAFTVGTAVTLDVTGLADVVTTLTVSAHGAQIDVQEIL